MHVMYICMGFEVLDECMRIYPSFQHVSRLLCLPSLVALALPRFSKRKTVCGARGSSTNAPPPNRSHSHSTMANRPNAIR